jgi:hypothetical protein
MLRALAIGSVLLGGCIDEFRGSNVQLDLSPAMPVQAPAGRAPGPGELPHDVHFTLYAISEGGGVSRLFELQQFEIHRIVDPSSPCFIDVGAHVPYPGLHVTRYVEAVQRDTGISDLSNPPPGATEEQMIDVATALQRQRNVAALASDAGIKVVTSASAGAYPPAAADCTEPVGIPPPACIEADANRRRLERCTAAWAADPDYFEGTDRILTSPLSGTTHGMVVGLNPVNLAPVGGAQFFVDESLHGFDAYAIYYREDGETAGPGTQLLFGRPVRVTRGVTHVHLTSVIAPAVTATLAIFADLNSDDVRF